jgi:Alpha-glutamyl/putrescinyl thymine pyrophosphorylase clade 3
MSATSREELHRRLQRYLVAHPLPGLRADTSQIRFAQELLHSERQFRARCLRRFGSSADPSKNDFHSLKAIVELFSSGDRDEAVWLAFLTIHFGIDVPQTIRAFYGKFGGGRWYWEAVRKRPEKLKEWMRENRVRVVGLRFGNHRKYESPKPDLPKGTFGVIRSFLEWTIAEGQGSPFGALASVCSDARGAEQKFDALYKELRVTRFGRTAKLDFLCLVGDLGILSVTPAHCYLKGSTGPARGALLMTTGRREGKLSERIDCQIKEMQRHIGVRVETMEDALCNWQKEGRSASNCKSEDLTRDRFDRSAFKRRRTSCGAEQSGGRCPGA